MREIPHDPAADDEDAALMRRLQRGDAAALDELVRRHQGRLVNFFRRLGAYGDAEDLAQDTFVRLFRCRYRRRAGARFTTFLFALARHAWLDGLRRRRRRERIAEAVAGAPPAPPPSAARRARDRLDVRWALERLPEKMRLPLVMQIFQGLTLEEIAAALGAPVGTVKSRIFHALERLRELLRDETTND